MLNRYPCLYAMLLLLLFMTACNSGGQVNGQSPTIEGYVIEADSQEIMVVSNISAEQAETLTREDLPALNEINAIVFTLPSDSPAYEKGQRVQVWADGSVRESFPAQAEARKVTVLD